MFYLPLSLQTWGTPSFKTVFQQEVCALDSKLLPLQQGLQYSSYAISDKLSITILSMQKSESDLKIKAALLYNGIIAGCSCADDPTPADETNEHCEVIFSINNLTAATSVKLFS